ncbi:TRAP transporter small permease [Azospirillum picis]|uniref:TRAP transporter small permease protein n=1 Tax=Azospirillum picis TaxID=488438 RepID=A0ABU0MJ47_9PROT|nr:TRAP transporter small permease [Azospirillum picis]MBP2299690.1 TRAP-type C4-dicarboxylate transport system permease small subunit [Azospirillum picis]MDQ0533486.1 TRAP-type C4-dicarboxylate transport system permease small subunit [Azospirillum picis]
MSSMSTPDALSPSDGKGTANGALRLLTGTASALSRLGGALSVLLIVVVLALTTAGVVARYVAGHPLEGIDEACGYLVVAMVMAGAAEALRTGHHIRIDLLLGAVGPRGRRWLDAWAHLAVLVFAVLLVRTGWHTALFSYEFEAYSSGQLELPLWIPQAALPVGAALLGLVALCQLVRTLAGDPTLERTGGH